jgi:hypothetical protein
LIKEGFKPRRLQKEAKLYLGTRHLYCTSRHYPDLLSVDQMGFDSAGTSSLIISLSILKDTSGSAPEGLRIGYADITLGTLLEKCSDNECRLEMYDKIWGISRISLSDYS